MRLEERFWRKVEKTDSCWLWRASLDRKGYGRFRIFVDGKRKPAHHVSVFLVTKRWPGYLMHTCDVPYCVNPDHLVEATHADNMRDAKNKGRMIHKRCKRGHILSDENVYCYYSSTQNRVKRTCLRCSLERRHIYYMRKKMERR